MPILTFLLNNWRWLASAGATFLLCLFLHNMRVDALQTEWATDTAAKVEAAEAAVVGQCEADKIKSKEVQKNYENRINTIAVNYERLRNLSAKCVAISSDPAAVPAGRAEHAGGNGLSVDWLRSFAATCETYRIQRLTDDEYLGR